MAILRHAQTHAPRRNGMRLELNKFYVLEEAARIIGISNEELRGRLHRYRHVMRALTFSWILLSGETIANILTGKGIRWSYVDEEHGRKVA